MNRRQPAQGENRSQGSPAMSCEKIEKLIRSREHEIQAVWDSHFGK